MKTMSTISRLAQATRRCLQIGSLGLVLVFSLGATATMAQSEAGNLPLYPVVPDNVKVPEGAKEVLQARLDQAVTTNGMGGMASLTNRFVLVPKIIVLQRNITQTAPAMTQVSLEAVLQVADMGSKRSMASTTIALNGVGATEEKAYTMAFQNMDVNSGPLADFMKTSREKILNFYLNNCDRIIAQAKTSIARNEPEEALEQLLSVPFEATTCFNKANALVPKAFRAYQLKQCDVFMQKAQAALASGNEEEAAQALAQVPSFSVCGKKADAIIAKLNKQWLMKYQNEFKIRKMKIDAQKWVAASLLESARRFYPTYILPGMVQPYQQQDLGFLR